MALLWLRASLAPLSPPTYPPPPASFAVTLARHAVCDAMPLPMLLDPSTAPAAECSLLFAFGHGVVHAANIKGGLSRAHWAQRRRSSRARALKLGSPAMSTPSRG